MKNFVPKYLDPGSRLGEILFGLVMVLTFTLGAGLTVSEGRTGVHELLIAAIGCNLAWGIIDAVMYVMDCLTVRTGKIRLVEAIQRAPDSDAAMRLIQDEFEPELQEILAPADAEALNRCLLTHITPARVTKTRLTKEDLYGGFACFWLVFLSCLPAALPFLIFSRPLFALRVSNFLLIALLYLVGHKWAKYSGTNPLATGSAMVAIGLMLVGIAMLLGG